MKATELRIGNYVWDDYSGEMIVSAILESSAVYLRKTIKLPSGEYLIQNIEPIPITEEWLLKLGFEKTKCISFNWQNEWIINSGEYGWEIGVLLGDFPEDNPNCGCVSVLQSKNIKIPGVPKDLYDKNNWTKEDEIRASKHKITAKKWRQPIAYYIKYVHQLQNLYFALTGNELTIK